jgi:hypothetical protein
MRAFAVIIAESVKRYARVMIPCACCFAAFAYIGWHLWRGGVDKDIDPEKTNNVEIIVKGPDGKIIPAIGRAPK